MKNVEKHEQGHAKKVLKYLCDRLKFFTLNYIEDLE